MNLFSLFFPCGVTLPLWITLASRKRYRSGVRAHEIRLRLYDVVYLGVQAVHLVLFTRVLSFKAHGPSTVPQAQQWSIGVKVSRWRAREALIGFFALECTALTRGADSGDLLRRGNVCWVPRPECPRTAAPAGGWRPQSSARARWVWPSTRGRTGLNTQTNPTDVFKR